MEPIHSLYLIAQRMVQRSCNLHKKDQGRFPLRLLAELRKQRSTKGVCVWGGGHGSSTGLEVEENVVNWKI